MSAALANLLQRRVRLQSCIDSRHLLFVVHSSRCDRFVPSIAIRLITGSSCNFSSQQQQRPKLPNKGNEQVLELGARTVIAPVKRKRRFEWSGGAIALLVICIYIFGHAPKIIILLVNTVDISWSRLVANISTTLETRHDRTISCTNRWTSDTVSRW
jgi:hypothetical protein